MLSIIYPTTSVIIPTMGRESLGDVIESVRSQTVDSPIEIIVVFDKAQGQVPAVAEAAALSADQILYTGGGRGGSRARNVGVKAATGKWIAFLDDDDLWYPTKLELQFSAARRQVDDNRIPIVGCRAKLVPTDQARRVIDDVPAKLIGDSEQIAEYLFHNRRPGSRRASFFTSSILAPAELCKSIPWTEGLARHQDWDWLLRASLYPDSVFVQVQDTLLSYSLGSEGSISAKADWRSSLDWALSSRRFFSRRAFCDFLCGQCLRYALQARDRAGVIAVAREIAVMRRLPSIGPVLTGLAGLMPRRNLQWLMGYVR